MAKRRLIDSKVNRSERGTRRTVTATAGPVQLTTQITTPKLTKTRTYSVGTGAVRVSAKVTTPKLPHRHGRFTLPLDEACKLLEGARADVATAVEDLDRAGGELEAQAEAKRQQAAEHLARYEEQYSDVKRLHLLSMDARRDAAALTAQVEQAAAQATHLEEQAEQARQDAADCAEQERQLLRQAEQLPAGPDRARLEADAATAARQAQILTKNAASLEADVPVPRTHAERYRDQAQQAAATAAHWYTEADRLHVAALAEQEKGVQLNGEADHDATDADAADTVADDARFNLTCISKRVTAARSGGEGAAKALDEAAQIAINTANRIDALALTGTSVTDRARRLAQEARR